MNKLFLTLVLTLMASLAYIGFAHAQSTEVRSSTPAKAESAKHEPTEWLKDRKFEVGEFKIKYSVLENTKGVYELVAECEAGGCAKLKNKIIKPEKHDHYPSIIKAAESELISVFGDAKKAQVEDKEEKEAKKKEEAELRARIRNCELDRNGKVWSKTDDQLNCASNRVEALLSSRDEKDINLAYKIWDKIVRPQFAKDVIAGKTEEASLAIRMVRGFVDLKNPQGEFVTSAKINMGVATQAYGYTAAWKHHKEKLQTEINEVNALTAAGNTEAATLKYKQLEQKKPLYAKLATHASTAINQLNNRFATQSQSQVPFTKEQYLSSHPEDATLIGSSAQITASVGNYSKALFTLSTNLNKASAVKNRTNAKAATSSDFDFTVGTIESTTAESAGVRRSTNSSGLSNRGDTYFDRALGHIRGEQNGDFQGAAIPQTAPEVNFSTITQQRGTLGNNNTFNNIRTRGQGLRQRGG